jgi:hypothetical protein
MLMTEAIKIIAISDLALNAGSRNIHDNYIINRGVYRM